MKYKNSDSKLKQLVRERILSHCIDIGLPKNEPISIFSLPADNFIFEQMTIDHYKNPRIVSVECNRELYEKIVFAKLSIEKIRNIDYQYGYDHEVLCNSDNRFNIIWLDYCSHLNYKLLYHLIPVVQGKNSSFTNKGKALISITLQIGRESCINELVQLSNYKTNKEYRLKGFPEQLAQYAKSNGKDLKLIKSLEYKDTERNSRACGMITYIFELTNELELRIDQL